jgi:hypothetical protein
MLFETGWLAIPGDKNGVICAVACALLKFTTQLIKVLMVAFEFTLAGHKSARGCGTLCHELIIPYVAISAIKAVSNIEACLLEVGISCVCVRSK